MPDNEPNTVWTINPLVKPSKRSSAASQQIRLSKWFVNNQKSEAWDQRELNTLHIRIVVLLVVVYACHVIGSPFILFVEDHTALTIIYVLETFLLIVSILFFRQDVFC